MYYEKIEQEEYNSHIFMKKVRRHRNIGISILIVQIMGGIYLLFNTWQYPLVYVSIDYKIRKDKKMSNDFRFEIQMEDLFLKHLKVVQQDFDLPEEEQYKYSNTSTLIVILLVFFQIYLKHPSKLLYVTTCQQYAY